MKTALALYVLAVMDGAFIGYRAAAGRNALIFKRSYYRRALWRGFVAGNIAVLVAIVLMAVWIAIFPQQSGELWRDWTSAGQRMLWVFLPYTLVIVGAFALRAIRSVDVRSFTSTVIFGPGVLIRPLVAVAGVAWGASISSRLSVWTVGGLILLMMLSLETLLSRLFYSRSLPQKST